MKGVIVTYPGALPQTFLSTLPKDLKLSYDGFDIGKLPTLSVEGRLFSYSSKTLILMNTPARTMWAYYRLIECTQPYETFLTSMVNGAHRLNFFNEIWAKVAKEKGIKVLTVDEIIKSPMALTTAFAEIFGIAHNVDLNVVWPAHHFDKNALTLVTNICGQGWANLKENSHG